jgi:hypothetical protein
MKFVLTNRPFSCSDLTSEFCFGIACSLLINNKVVTHPSLSELARRNRSSHRLRKSS